MAGVVPKIVVVCGPTASGKTGLGIALAKKFNGEIISADSRQVYKGMTVATAKPLGEWKKIDGDDTYVVGGIPHHLVDVLQPDAEMSVADFKIKAMSCIADITARKKLPIVVGGTGLYIWALVDNLLIPNVLPNVIRRNELEKKTLNELLGILASLDKEALGLIDIKNPRRVIRAIEIVEETGVSFIKQRERGPVLVEALQIGISRSILDLYQRIDKRVHEQFDSGLVAETQTLLANGYTLDLPSMSGIGYPEVSRFLQGETTRDETITLIQNATHHYAKRQNTWFKRDKRICWVDGEDAGRVAELVESFLRK